MLVIFVVSFNQKYKNWKLVSRKNKSNLVGSKNLVVYLKNYDIDKLLNSPFIRTSNFGAEAECS